MANESCVLQSFIALILETPFEELEDRNFGAFDPGACNPIAKSLSENFNIKSLYDEDALIRHWPESHVFCSPCQFGRVVALMTLVVNNRTTVLAILKNSVKARFCTSFSQLGCSYRALDLQSQHQCM